MVLEVTALTSCSLQTVDGVTTENKVSGDETDLILFQERYEIFPSLFFW